MTLIDDMKYQFLPHYFKYIGLTLFLLTGLLPNIESFADGFNGYPHGTRSLGIPEIFHSQAFHLITYLAILIYALAKDKVFDEFMVQIRLGSMYIVFFLTLIFIVFGLLINDEWKISPSYIFEGQIILFLVINKIRKQLGAR